MADVIKGIDEAIEKIKSVAPVFQAFADMKEILDFMGNNKGVVLKFSSDIQRMTKELKDRQAELDRVYVTINQTQIKVEAIEGTYKSKLAETEASYKAASDKAKAEYLTTRDNLLENNETLAKTLIAERSRLTSEISKLSQELQKLQGEYNDLKARFK